VTPTPTGSFTPPPSGCSNILVNGDFESTAAWQFGGSPIPGKYTSIPVHGGLRAVQLGNPPDSGNAAVYSYSSVRQGVSIPQGATLQLRWWHNYGTQLPTSASTSNTEARQEVILLRPNGDTLRVLQRVRQNDNGWQQSVLDLTQFAGYNFVLYFNVINYAGTPLTWGYIDDVELLVCNTVFPTFVPTATFFPSTPTPTWTPTWTPTPTPTGSVTPSSGTTVEGNGYALTVLTFQNPSNMPDYAYSPVAGQHLVGVQIIVRNISGATFTSYYSNAILIDTFGTLYQAKGSIIQGQIQSIDVQPGQQVQGWVGFQVPDGAPLTGLRYTFGSSGVTLQVGLPPSSTSAQAVSAAASVSAGAGTPTVTPTNTGNPVPTVTLTNTAGPMPTMTPTPTNTTMAMAPLSPTAVLAQQQDVPRQSAAAQSLVTPTPALVVQREVVPNGCVELISNGSFDEHVMGWSEEGSMILPEYSYRVSTTTTETTTAQKDIAIRLGLTGKSAVAGLSATQQLIRLPKDSAKITLSFRYYPLYDDPVSPGDFQFVDIYHGDSGRFLGRALGVQENKRTWIERHYDLTPYAGQPVRIFFIASNDGKNGTIAMYVDDVSVLACRASQTAPQNAVANAAQPSGGPTLSAQASQLQASPPLTNTGATSGTQPLASNKPSPSPVEQAIQQQGFAFGRIGGVLAVLGLAGGALVLLTLAKRFPK
jgi:hypothetical protein